MRSAWLRMRTIAAVDPLCAAQLSRTGAARPTVAAPPVQTQFYRNSPSPRRRGSSRGRVSGGVSEARTSGTSQSTSVPRPFDSLLRNLICS